MTTAIPSILLIDDDTELTALLSEYLSGHNIRTEIADNGKIALDKIQYESYDLLVLDIMMPEIDGLAVLKQLANSNNHIPIIMLTAKGDDIDRIIGLEMGADDYISKPCNPRELLARINAVIKRSQRSQNSMNNDYAEVVLPKSLFQLDINQRTCSVNDDIINLTSTEFDLLYTLAINKGKVIDKSALSLSVLQRELQPFDRSIDVHISRLRKKLSPFHENPIQSIRGKGYQLTA